MIYLLEDDDSIRELVCYTLTQIGWEAKGFSAPSAFFGALKQEIPALILLDIMLPEEDGLSVLKKLRAASKTKHVPVMMLTAKGSEYDKVIGLDAGADDYLAKPFGMMELTARVKALLRRSTAAEEKTQEKKTYQIEGLFVDLARHVVTVDHEEIALTFKEFELLCLLLENRGIVLNRDQILNRVWGYSFDGENRTVDVHIRTLRQKLGTCGALIETVRGVGYKIDGESV